MLQNISVLVRTLILAGLVCIGGWWTFFLRGQLVGHEEALAKREQEIQELNDSVAERDRKIGDLSLRIAEQDQQIEDQGRIIQELEVAMWLLKVDHRVARIEVLDQSPAGDGSDVLVTRLLFVELGPEGQPVGEPRELTVEGSVVYVEGLVIKFDDTFVQGGDSLRGTSVCLFRRLYGEEQKPSAGVELDPVGMLPLVYSGDEAPDASIAELWKSFWDYANDPELAAQKGVRAIHGEAPFIEMRPGKVYRVELRASGGLSIRAE